MKKHLLAVLTLVVLSLAATGSVLAVTEFDQNITPDVIFGSGNANGDWTTERVGGLEIGLRAKLRFDAACTPQNIFNSNGDGTYSFAAGVAPDGPGGAADCSGTATPVWSFEWSVNTDYDGSSGLFLDEYTYELGLDFNPTVGTSYCTFDNITPSVPVPFWDHAIGNNGTANGGGTVYATGPTYTAALAAENVAQNSWRYDFFDAGSPCGAFDPNVDGTYDIYLRVIDDTGAEVGRSSIGLIVGNGGGPALPASRTGGLIALVLGLGLVIGYRVLRG